MIGKLDGPPLGKSLAGHGGPVAVHGEKRFYAAFPNKIVVKDFVNDPADILKNISAVDEGLIMSGGICDIKIIAARAVIFGIDPIEGKGNLR